MKNAPFSRVETERDVTAFSGFKTPARTAFFFDVRSKDDLPVLSEAVASANASELPVAYLGDGTNCLFAFDRFPGLLVKNSIPGFRRLEENRFEAGSAEKVHSVALVLATGGNAALLPWIGLPGTFGGAVVGNAGCFGLETADVFETADVWNVFDGRLETLSKPDMAFGYRKSTLKNRTDRFVVSARFDLSLRAPGNPYESMGIAEFRELRRAKQPAGRTCGSFFKNPEGASAGALIDRAGLKGWKIGGAEVSTLHANFFLAAQGADWRDLIALRDLIKSRVSEEFGIELSEEARIITENG